MRAAPAAEHWSNSSISSKSSTTSHRNGLTLLRSALLRRKVRIASVGLVGAGVELLVTAPLQRSANVHKRVALDRERAVLVSRVKDGSGGNATKRAGERLRVCLADSKGVDAGSAEKDKKGGGELHLDRVGGD